MGVAVAVMVAGACGSTKPASNAGGGGAGGGTTYTIGLLTDASGLGANTSASSPLGVKAGIGVAGAEGYKIKFVVADTTSTPAGALTAAQKLVEEDHVFAVIAVSGLTFAAAGYLTSHHVPVVGAADDSTEWITSSNMFSIMGTQDFTKVESTYGLLFQKLGVTDLGTLGYSISPSSAEAAKGAAVSVAAVGIKAGYVNPDFAFGSTNVLPVALAMKQAGVDGLITSVETNASFALITALRQEGVDIKGAVFPTGYGGDLVQGGPGAVQVAQGLYFLSTFEPVEMDTAATQRFQGALKTYAGVTGEPTFAEYLGYVSVDGLITGLEAAGSHPTQASFINAMQQITSYNGAGLFGSHTVGFSMSGRGQAAGADNCFWVTQFSGTSFHLVAGADPICGTILPGQTVSASS